MGVMFAKHFVSSLVWFLFAIGFVCFLVGGYVWYWVSVFVSWGLGLVLGLCVCWSVAM